SGRLPRHRAFCPLAAERSSRKCLDSCARGDGTFCALTRRGFAAARRYTHVPAITCHQDPANRRGLCGGGRMRPVEALLMLPLAVSLLMGPRSVEAASPDKPHRIGMLERTSATVNAPNIEGFRRGLRELGYVEGEHYVIEYRSADGHDERFPTM